MANDCLERLSDTFKDLAKSEVKTIVDNLERLRVRSANSGESFDKVAIEFINDRRRALASHRKQQAQNIVKNTARLQFYLSGEVGDIRESVIARIAGSNVMAKGSNLSVDRLHKTNLGIWGNRFVTSLKEKGHLDTFKSGEFDRDIMVELFEMRPDGNPGKSGSKIAKEIAESIRDIQKNIVNDMRAAGIDIGEIPGYIMRQSHDPRLLDKVSFEEWYEFIMPKLDKNKTFRDVEDSEIESFMSDVYNDIIEGNHGKTESFQISDQLLTIGQGSNISNKLKRSRSLHFADGESFFQYNERFGKETLGDSVFSSLDRNARNIALYDVLGSNPEAAIRGDIQRLRKRLKADKRVDDLKKLDEIQRSALKFLATVDGSVDRAGYSIEAKVLKGARQVTNLTSLGGAMIASLPDFAIAGGITSGATGKNLLSTHLGLFTDYFKNIKKSNANAIAAKTAILVDDMLADFFTRFDVGDSSPGLLTKTQRPFFKITGLENHTAASKVAVAKMFSTEMAENLSKKFDELNPRMRGNMERYSITADDWELMKLSTDEFADGTRGVTPEALTNLSDGVIKGKLDELGIKKTAAEWRFEASRKLGSYLSDHADIGSPTPNARTKTQLLQGTSEDDHFGQALRLVAQFKSFPWTAAGQIMPRILLAAPEAAGLTSAQALKTGKGDILNLLGVATTLTVLGYMSMSLKEMAKGKTPKDPKSPEVWREAMIRGGAAGLLGDWLLGEQDNRYRSFAKDILGPVPGRAFDLVNLFKRARDGDTKVGEIFNEVIRNTPGQNIFWLRGAANYLFLYNIQESLNPGFNSRLERNARRDDQEFFEGTFLDPENRLKPLRVIGVGE